MTPLVLENTVWAGTSLGSYSQASSALKKLSQVELAPKQVRRITTYFGKDCVKQRRQDVQKHRRRPLMQRATAAADAQVSELMAVMMDGGRFQRRDHFRDRKSTAKKAADLVEVGEVPRTDAAEKPTHWREDKVGIVLSMQSEVHAADPAPEFPEWLAGAKVVAEIAKLAARDEESSAACSADTTESAAEESLALGDWKDLAPKLLSREVIASSCESESFGWHLEWKAWTMGLQAAKRQAFVADGLAVNWTIHKKHFSQMTGILDLMHALSYAWRAAAGLEAPNAYRRYATWIWQGQVQRVIDELKVHQEQIGRPEPDASDSDPRERVQRAITYYTNHRERMNYPTYRRDGLPLTSSHIESTIKQINARVKGTEKFWNKDSGEALLQLRADSLSDSQPLDKSWNQWRETQTGSNHYRKLSA